MPIRHRLVHASEVYEFILFKSYYDELGRTNYHARRIHIIIRYWFKVINSEEHTYMKKQYNVMLTEFNDRLNIQNWASLVRNTLVFFNVWIAQGVEDKHIFFKC